MLCPLCENVDTYLADKIPIDKIKTAWAKKFEIEVFSDIVGLTNVELYSCSACGLKFYYPFTLAGGADLYEKLNKKDLYYQKEKWEFFLAVRDIRGIEKLMEIGCGEGKFLRLAYENGVKEAAGIEICGSAIECGRKNGFNVDNISLEKASHEYEGYFDAVCAFQVLEHSSTPRSFIENCLKMLKSNGKFILAVPNSESYLKNIFLLLDMPPHHVTKWSAETLKKLCDIFPLKLVKLKQEPLAENQVNFFIDSVFESLTNIGLPNFLLGGYSRKAMWLFCQNRWVRRFLRGQTIYACYTKLR